MLRCAMSGNPKFRIEFRTCSNACMSCVDSIAIVFMSASRSRATSRRSIGSLITARAVVRRLAITRSPLSSRRSIFFFESRASCALRNAYISGGLSRSFLPVPAITIHRPRRLLDIVPRAGLRRLRGRGVAQDRKGPERAMSQYPRSTIAASHPRRPTDRSGRLAGRNDPPRLGLRTTGAVLLLLLVLGLEFREIERDVFGEPVFPVRAAGGDVADKNVLQLDRQVFERLLARLAHDQLGLLDVLAVAAMQHQRRRRLVEVVREVDVLHRDFARAGAAAHMGGSCLGHAP